jgi:hypothetical protein
MPQEKLPLSPDMKMRMLWVLLQGLREYCDANENLKTGAWSRTSYEDVRSGIVDQILSLLRDEPILNWKKMPYVAGMGLEELLTEEDWSRVAAMLASGQPMRVRTSAVTFCGHIGGERAVDILLSGLDIGIPKLEDAVVSALQSLIDQAEHRVYQVLCDESASKQQRCAAINVLEAASNLDYLDDLIAFGINNPELRESLKDAVVGIAHDQYCNYLDWKLLCYLKMPPYSPEYQFVLEALIDAREKVIAALAGCLVDTKFRITARRDDFIDILSKQSRFYDTLSHVNATYRSALSTLLLSSTCEHARSALEILHRAEIDGTVALVKSIYGSALPAEQRSLRKHLREMSRNDRDKEYAWLLKDLRKTLRPALSQRLKDLVRRVYD